MTMQQPATPGAMRRITGFVAVLWIIGAISALVMVASALGRVGAFWGIDDAPPVTVERTPVPVQTAEGDVWTGSGDSVIDLPPELLNRPIVVSMLDGEGSAYLTINDTEIDPDGYGYLAGSLAGPGQPPTVVALYEASQLSIRTDDDWMLQIAPFDPELIAAPVVSGVGDAVVLSTGPAASAVITAEGDPDTPVWVDVLTIEGMDIAVTEEVRDSPIEFDWATSPYVLLVISVRDETSWTLEIDGGAR